MSDSSGKEMTDSSLYVHVSESKTFCASHKMYEVISSPCYNLLAINSSALLQSTCYNLHDIFKNYSVFFSSPKKAVP